jgi:DNA-binding response OmpR family regulator
VLCVEDDPQLLPILGIGLTTHGFEAVTAANAVEALAQFKAYRGEFDCVLTDHDMPGDSGSRLSAQLRANGYQGRIIVMSGRLTEKDLDGYQGLSISGFFRKPFGLQMLLSMIEASSPVAAESKTA